ncbi:MAG TPA: nuclear transport factor 2 family protein [Rhizomicrobium sp.]
MKALIVAFAATLAMAVPAVAADLSATQQKLIDLEAAWSKAVVAKDVAALSSIVADDWTGQNDSGKLADKAQMIADMKAGKTTASSMTNRDEHVRVMGDMAIVQGADDEKSADNGKDTSGAFTWMDIFEKRGGKWVAIASQNSKVTPNM